jgi:ATP-dependent RNA helicase RhlE
MEGFRSGAYRIMVATDIAARGIDVLSISHVINYDMPDTADAYTHRIGRTGRAEQAGEAYSLFTPADVDALRAVERVLGHRLERRILPDFDYRGPDLARDSEPNNRWELPAETGLSRSPQTSQSVASAQPLRGTGFRPARRYAKRTTRTGSGFQPTR